QGLALVLGLGARPRAGRQGRSGRHHAHRARRRALRRHAARPHALRLPAGRRVGRHPAGDPRQRAARLRHAAAVRLLHRLGSGRRPLRQGHRDDGGAQHDALLRARVVRPVHAVPQRHRQGVGADRAAALGSAASRRPLAGHARRVDLRPRPGGAEPDRLRRQVLSSRARTMNAITRAELAEIDAPLVTFELDGRAVVAPANRTIIEIADAEGVEIPRLCYKPGLDAVGNCRACMVEIGGERVLAPSCCRTPTAGMKVTTQSERVRKSQKLVLELLLSDMPEAEYTRHNELDAWAERLGVGKPRFAARAAVAPDLSHPAMAVNLSACIQCTRCVRACRDEQVNDVIGLAWRGNAEKIVFDMDDPMGNSTCVACGECVQACPTGALMPARDVALAVPDKRVESLCPFCGVGCQVTYNVKDDRILFVEGRDGPANHARLCVKGRYGFDYAHHPHRLTRPLIRRADAPGKRGDFTMDPERVMDVFREATWEEALAFAGGTLKVIRDRHGPKALAGFGSAKGSNEEAYLFQKLVRTGFRNNNVDHCTRLCHASSVAALLEGIGSGAVTATFNEVEHADVIVIIGANPSENHPVAATYFKQAAKRGAKLIVIDPRGQALREYATYMLQFKPASDVALLNAVMHVIVEEGLYDVQYLQAFTENFERYKEHLAA